MSSPVVVTGLRYSIAARAILRGVELVVGPGEVVAVMGLSGGGKTTLLKCMAGLTRPTAGSIRVGTVELTELDEGALGVQRRRMGMVFQYSALFDSLTVYENVVFGLRHRPRHEGRLTEAQLRRIAAERLAAVGLHDVEEMLPAELSGGMRKRVGLARALATDPEVVFYDEPTSGLDPVVARLIDDLILDVRRQLGVTSVLVSHDVGSVMRTADRVALLYEGRIIACGPPSELSESADPVVRQFIEGRATGPIRPGA